MGHRRDDTGRRGARVQRSLGPPSSVSTWRVVAKSNMFRDFHPDLMSVSHGALSRALARPPWPPPGVRGVGDRKQCRALAPTTR